MKKVFYLIASLLVVGCASSRNNSANKNSNQSQVADPSLPTVYVTREITPESLVKIYEALGVKAIGNVGVKISTGESGGHNYLKPELIGKLVNKVGGTIVECNTAYGGSRATFEKHWQTIKEHGFLDIAKVDLMDEDGSMTIPVADNSHLKYDIVGKHLANYNFMINLAHFKGHEMGGFGGVLKNQSIGFASQTGKGYIHSAGYTENVAEAWKHTGDQDGFLESMAAAAQAVHNYFGDGKIVYIDVMNNMSIDCDCSSHPQDPKLKDYGILASTDPVAVDQACLDIIFGWDNKAGDTAQPLIDRINKLHGVHTVEHAEKIGLGSRKYNLVSID